MSAKAYEKVSTAGMARDRSFRARHRDEQFWWHVQSCARRGIENLLTIADYAEISAKPCHYCGAPPVARGVPSGLSTLLTNGVDREDNSQPYSVTNCVACCKLCNAMKSGLSRDVFLAHVDRIAQFQKDHEDAQKK